MPKTSHNYSLRIYYEDTDAGGIVYYANYLKFFERARTEWLRDLGISQAKFLELTIGFVVLKVDMDNIASAKLDDLLTVNSTILNLKRASLIFHQKITNQAQEVICIATVRIACVSFQGNNSQKAKPTAIPKSILGAFKRVC
ncbi:MAG: tol-pal system-associated acyl-CoA thioesterase [Colwellia sp.]